MEKPRQGQICQWNYSGVTLRLGVVWLPYKTRWWMWAGTKAHSEGHLVLLLCWWRWIVPGLQWSYWQTTTVLWMVQQAWKQFKSICRACTVTWSQPTWTHRRIGERCLRHHQQNKREMDCHLRSLFPAFFLFSLEKWSRSGCKMFFFYFQLCFISFLFCVAAQLTHVLKVVCIKKTSKILQKSLTPHGLR